MDWLKMTIPAGLKLWQKWNWFWGSLEHSQNKSRDQGCFWNNRREVGVSQECPRGWGEGYHFFPKLDKSMKKCIKMMRWATNIFLKERENRLQRWNKVWGILKVMLWNPTHFLERVCHKLGYKFSFNEKRKTESLYIATSNQRVKNILAAFNLISTSSAWDLFTFRGEPRG